MTIQLPPEAKDVQAADLDEESQTLTIKVSREAEPLLVNLDGLDSQKHEADVVPE